MKIEQAINILIAHNKWRRGGEKNIHTPKNIGLAIDFAIHELKKLIK